MIQGRLRRTTTLLSVTALALGMASTGVLASGAGASSATTGVTAKTITIGASVPLSGLAVSYAPVSASANAVFNYINKKGGINGRTIKYIRLDDCYNIAAYGLGCTAGASTTTLSVNKVLVAQDHVFATVGSLGTQAQDSVLSYLKQNKVPQLFVNSGSSDWNQPSKYPYTFGFQTSYKAEGKIFAQYIKQNDAGKTVGFIGQGDDFGANGLAGLANGGLKIAAANSLTYNTSDAVTQTASDIQADIGTLQANNVQVVVLDSVPAFTQTILNIAHLMGFSAKWIISSVGSDPTSVNSPLEAGAISLDYFPAASNNKDAWIPWLRKVLLADKTDFPTFTSTSVITGNQLYGASWAVAFAETLKAEGRHVTRAGFINTLEHTTLATPAIVPLRYSAGNHQGLLGGTIATVAPNGTAAPINVIEPSSSVYKTNDGAGTAIHASKFTVVAIPGWLK
jgi:branched-chain amino acid transport system substrate-binding protein